MFSVSTLSIGQGLWVISFSGTPSKNIANEVFELKGFECRSTQQATALARKNYHELPLGPTNRNVSYGFMDFLYCLISEVDRFQYTGATGVLTFANDR